MRIEELDFEYPESTVATERRSPSRVMRVKGGVPMELPKGLADLLEEFQPGDCLVINDTRVLRRRLFTKAGLEILFLAPTDASLMSWRVLCPSSRWKNGVIETLRGGARLMLLERGRTQVVGSDRALDERYFESHGELPIPPYIQKARGERHNRATDSGEYQTAWANVAGSLAAPTASLHFSSSDLARLKERGVDVATITLHVGLGTFLPVTSENLDEHVMHSEAAVISAEAWRSVQAAKSRGARVWALGTTVTRTLESAARGLLSADGQGGFVGETDLFIRPGFEWRVVDGLLTNFHQPRSTLLALVAAFAGMETVKACYKWAIERGFRLFSYGDLTAWTR